MLAARLSIAYLGAGAHTNLSDRFDRRHSTAIAVLRADSDRWRLLRAAPHGCGGIVVLYLRTADISDRTGLSRLSRPDTHARTSQPE
jgi:hypothetical protein